MTSTAPRRVASRDGTEIGYWRSGTGPPLLLVHGTAGVHERFGPLVGHLEPHATVHVMDRRGRGASGDAPSYEIAREHEDVAAVVDAIADACGSRVDVYGHSFGGQCAVGAALLTPNVRSLLLYEGWPPVRPELLAVPPGAAARVDALVEEGDHEGAFLTFLREIARTPEKEIAAVRAQPSWPARVGAAPTITRELAAFAEDVFDPEAAARIAVPVLVLTGAESPEHIRDDPDRVAAALPDARVAVVPGQQHLADVLAPALFAEHLLAFLAERP